MRTMTATRVMFVAVLKSTWGVRHFVTAGHLHTALSFRVAYLRVPEKTQGSGEAREYLTLFVDEKFEL